MSTLDLQVCNYCGVPVAWCDCVREVALRPHTDRAQILAAAAPSNLGISTGLGTSLVILATSPCLRGASLSVGLCLRSIQARLIALITSAYANALASLIPVMFNITPPVARCVAPSPRPNSQFFDPLSTAPSAENFGHNPLVRPLDAC